MKILYFLPIIGAMIFVSGGCSNRGATAKQAVVALQLSNIGLAIDGFHKDNGRYPSQGEGLDVLMRPPSYEPHWHGPYLPKAIPPDPWGNQYIYVFPGKRHPDKYDLSSTGPDGLDGTRDDITNWSAK
jgi:general secretion pathway protein G